ncbi:MAG: CPBP family intramembrane glutamic endopeptidase [Myxococcota bacterium]
MAGRGRLALLVYGLMGALAFGWGALRGQPNLYHHPEPWLTLDFPYPTLLSLGLGLAVAVAVIYASRVLVRRARWARELHVEFRSVLGPVTSTDIAILAVSSGLSEELLFRGAMQPTLGLVLSSVIFGLVHIGPNRRFLPWTAWALLMGFVFGGVYELTGELLGPVIAHVLINHQNLHFIRRHDPEPRDKKAAVPQTPRLI